MGRSAVRRILRGIGTISIILGLILVAVLFEFPYVIERSERLIIEENQNLGFVEASYSGHAESLSGTVSVNPPSWPEWFSLSVRNQSEMDYYESHGWFDAGHLFQIWFNHTAEFSADIEGEGTCYIVLSREFVNDSLVLTAEVDYEVTGTNPYYLVPGIALFACGIVLVVYSRHMRLN